MNIHEILNGFLEFENLSMEFSAVMKGIHNHVVFLDTTLYVDAVTNSTKLPCHKYLKRQYFQNSHPYNPPTSLSPALDNMSFVTDVMAGLCNYNECVCAELGD